MGQLQSSGGCAQRIAILCVGSERLGAKQSQSKTLAAACGNIVSAGSGPSIEMESEFPPGRAGKNSGIIALCIVKKKRNNHD
jgi:hypothetical protein